MTREAIIGGLLVLAMALVIIGLMGWA